MLESMHRIEADDDNVSILADLGKTGQSTTNTAAGIEKIVYQLYQWKTHITNIRGLRWLLFQKKQAQSIIGETTFHLCCVKKSHLVSSL